MSSVAVTVGKAAGAVGSPGRFERLAVVVLLALATAVQASQEPYEVVKVLLSESVILKVPGVKRISITNPTYADVTVIGEDEVRVDGLSRGRTTMYLWDPRGRRRYEVVVVSRRDDVAGQIREAINMPELSVAVINDRVLLRGYVPSETDRRFATEIARVFQEPVVDLMQVRGQKAYDPGEQIKELIGLPDVKVEVVLDPNAAMAGRGGVIQGAGGQITAPPIAAIILHGSVDDQRDRIRAEQIAGIFSPRVLDYIGVVQPLQVLVQSHILELGRNTATQYGFNWGTTQVSGTAGGPISVSGAPAQQLRYLENVFNAPHGEGTFFGKHVPETGQAWPWLFENINPLDPLFVTISWLLTEGKGRLVANPRLVTQAGTQASVTAGFQIPYPSVGALGVPAVQFVQANVTLQIQPDVDHRGNIDNQLTVTVATPDASRSVIVAGTSVPAIATRTTQSHVTVKDGEHIIISGLLQEQDSKQFSKTPFFSRIPFLGNLFTSKNYQTDQSELIVVVTPNLVTGPLKYKAKAPASVQASRFTTDPRMAPRALELASPPPPGPLPGTSPFGGRRIVPSPAPIDPDGARIKVHELVEGMKTDLRTGQAPPPLPDQGVGAAMPPVIVSSVPVQAPARPRSKSKKKSRKPVKKAQASPAEEAALGDMEVVGSTRFGQGGAVIAAPEADPLAAAAAMRDEMPTGTEEGLPVVPVAPAAAAPPQQPTIPPRMYGAPAAPVAADPSASSQSSAEEAARRISQARAQAAPQGATPADAAAVEPGAAADAGTGRWTPNDKAKQVLQQFYEQLKARLDHTDAPAQGKM